MLGLPKHPQGNRTRTRLDATPPRVSMRPGSFSTRCAGDGRLTSGERRAVRGQPALGGDEFTVLAGPRHPAA